MKKKYRTGNGKSNGNGNSKKVSTSDVVSGTFYFLLFIGVVVVLVYFLTKSPEHFKLGTSKPTCTKCTPGGYVSPPGTSCVPCPTGSAGLTAGGGIATCSPCTVGTNYSATPGASKCIACTKCTSGKEYTKSPCTKTSNTVCSPCPSSKMTSGTCYPNACGPGGGCDMTKGYYCDN